MYLRIAIANILVYDERLNYKRYISLEPGVLTSQLLSYAEVN